MEEDKSVPPYNSEQLPLPQNDVRKSYFLIIISTNLFYNHYFFKLEIDEISTLDLSNFVEVPSSQNYVRKSYSVIILIQIYFIIIFCSHI